MDAKSVNPDDEMIAPKRAIREVTGFEPSLETIGRWSRRGLAGINEERIRLEVWPVGRKLFTTRNAVRSWLNAVTNARMARVQRTQATIRSVSDNALKAAGLLPTQNRGAK